LYKCSSCGLIIPYPHPYTEDTKIEVYNRDYNKNETKIDYDSPYSRHYIKNFIPYLSYINKYKIRGNHLDVGCGLGYLLHLCKLNGFETEGIELNKQLVKLLNKKGFKVHDKELGSPEYHKNYYDLITANHVLEHIDNINDFLKNINNLLKNDGYLIFACPYINGIIPKILRTKWYGQGFGTHLNFFSIKSIKKLLKNNGFKLVEIKINSMDYTTYNMPHFFKLIIRTVSKLISNMGLGDNIFVVAKKTN